MLTSNDLSAARASFEACKFCLPYDATAYIFSLLTLMMMPDIDTNGNACASTSGEPHYVDGDSVAAG